MNEVISCISQRSCVIQLVSCNYFELYWWLYSSSCFHAYSALSCLAFSALTLLVGHQEEHPDCKIEWWCVGMVIGMEWGACLHMAEPMPLPSKTSLSLALLKSRMVFTFLVPAEPGCPGKEAINRCFIFVIQSQLHIVMNTGLGYITCFVWSCWWQFCSQNRRHGDCK